jgi:signal transduction histidine kinase
VVCFQDVECESLLKKLGLRSRITLVMLWFCLVPIMLLSIFIGSRLRGFTMGSGILYYKDLLTQFSETYDRVYQLQARSMSSLLLEDSVKAFFNVQEPIDAITERALDQEITEDYLVRSLYYERIEGLIYFVDLTRPSSFDRTPYKLLSMNSSGAAPEMSGLLISSGWRRIVETAEKALHLVNLPGRAFPGIQESTVNCMVLPVHFNEFTGELDQFILLRLFPDYFYNMYRYSQLLERGTLYILDSGGSLMSQNHPGPGDLMLYDATSDSYKSDAQNGQSRLDRDLVRMYKRLNTNPDILTHKTVINEMQALRTGELLSSELRFEFDSRRQLAILQGTGASESLLVFVITPANLPIPAEGIILGLILVVLTLAILIVITSFSIGRNLTRPVHQLSVAVQQMAENDFAVSLDTPNDDEFGRLVAAFNQMAERIRINTANLEYIIKDNTRELEAKNDVLERQNRFKSQFLAAMSHDIRTPLNAIIGFNELLLYKSFDKTEQIKGLLRDYFKENPAVVRGLSTDYESLVQRFDMVENYPQLFSLILELCLPEDKSAAEVLEVLKGLLQEEQENNDEYLRHTQTSASHLLNIVNNILDISRIEAGRVDVHLGPVDIKSLVEQLSAETTVYIQQKNKENSLSYSSKIAGDVPGTFTGDETKLRESISNLLTNSVKFTSAGKIELAVYADEEWVSFEVRDDGPGISRADQKIMFDEFERLNQSGTEGSGLGLSLVQKLVSIMKGNIKVESEKGKGSCFTVSVQRDPGSVIPGLR